jgi:carbonic anhydrase
MSASNIPPATALSRLKEGNQRFVSNVRSIASLTTAERRAEVAARQEPFAIVLGCSDSRTPAEIVFDQGLGDLFVIRVAGNIVAPSQVGSVEFAAERFGTRLVVVMGHSFCGAIDATLDAIEQPEGPSSKNQLSIVDRIRPVISPLVQTGIEDRNVLKKLASRANISAAANHLRHGSRVLEQLTLEDGLVVVGAYLDLETGIVDFFDGAP